MKDQIKMLKTYFLYLSILASTAAYSQLNDTINLEEVKVSSSMKKVVHLKTQGKLSSLTGNAIKGLMSKVDDIPEGTLASITFFFNSKLLFFIKDLDQSQYKDVALCLLIYDVNADGTPRAPLIDKTIIFKLQAKSKSMKLDLRPLHLNASKTMFFGFELSKKQITKDFKIMTKCNGDPAKILFCKTWNSDQWYYSGVPCGMKLDLGVTVAQ